MRLTRHRTLACAATLGLAVPALLAQETPKVTLRTGTTTLAQALTALSSKTGQSLDAIPRLRGEVVLVEVEDAPVADVLAKLATAVGAEWEKTSGGYRLVLGTELERTQIAALRAARAEAIQRTLADRTKTMGDGRLDDAAIQKLVGDAQRVQDDLERQMRDGSRTGGSVFVNAISSRPTPGTPMPADRTMFRILLAIGSAELAKIEPGERVVWSTAANQTQIRMPVQAQTALAEFVADHNRIAQAVRDSGKPTGDPTRQLSVRLSGLVDLQSRPIGRIGKALLVIHREVGENVLFVQLRVTDGQGTDAANASTVIPFEAPAEPVALSLKNPSAKVAPGPLAKEFAELLRSANQRGSSFPTDDGVIRAVRVVTVSGEAMPESEATNPVTLTKEWAERLANPEAADPLSFIVGDSLRRAISGQNVNLIACLPDALIESTSRALTSGEPTVAAVLALAGSNAVSVRQAEGWITIAPRFPTEHRALRLDRAALGQTLRRGLAQARLGLDDIANYARAQTSPLAMEGVDAAYFALLANLIAEADTIRSLAPRRDMLRFYAASSVPQRNALFAGQPLALGNLNAAQGQALKRMVFGSGFMSPLTLNGNRDLMGGPGGLLSEPTELLPAGIPRNGLLTCRLEEQPSVVATNSKTGASQNLSADQLAMMLAQREKPDLPVFGAPKGEFDLFKAAITRRMRFTFQFSEAVAMDQSLTDKVPPAGSARGVAMAQLPPALLAMVQERKRMYLEGRIRGNVDVIQIGGQRIRRGGGTPPPGP